MSNTFERAGRGKFKFPYSLMLSGHMLSAYFYTVSTVEMKFEKRQLASHFINAQLHPYAPLSPTLVICAQALFTRFIMNLISGWPDMKIG